METHVHLDHVAVLVEDIEATAAAWQLPEAGAIESFPDEGTRELYCGAGGRSGRVLVMQPIGPGPYERAMAKRGSGLHHIALSVRDVRAYVSSVAGSGWLLHPRSLETFKESQQAWLCRPGFPSLVELSEASGTYERAYVQEVSLSVPDVLAPMIDRLGCEALVRAADEPHSFVVDGRRVRIDGVGR